MPAPLQLSEALTLLLGRLGERAIYTDEIVHDDFAARRIREATWLELAEREWVTARHGVGCWRYQLTGPGWREALKLTGELETREFGSRFERLNTALEVLVYGRNEETLAPTQRVAARAQVPEPWLYNVLESRIWEQEHGRRGASLDETKTQAVVPVDFNKPLKPEPRGAKFLASRRFSLSRPGIFRTF